MAANSSKQIRKIKIDIYYCLSRKYPDLLTGISDDECYGLVPICPKKMRDVADLCSRDLFCQKKKTLSARPCVLFLRIHSIVRRAKKTYLSLR